MEVHIAALLDRIVNFRLCSPLEEGCPLCSKNNHLRCSQPHSSGEVTDSAPGRGLLAQKAATPCRDAYGSLYSLIRPDKRENMKYEVTTTPNVYSTGTLNPCHCAVDYLTERRQA